MPQTLVTDQYEIISTAKISNAERVLRERAVELIHLRFPNLSPFSVNTVVEKFVKE